MPMTNGDDQRQKNERLAAGLRDLFTEAGMTLSAMESCTGGLLADCLTDVPDCGYFLSPSIYRDVPPGSRLAQEEIFGPVLSVIPFDDEAEAVRIANGTVYGLAAYVWTADLSRAMRMVRQIRSSVRINSAAPRSEGAGFTTAIEPARQSGIGAEGGLAGLESYMRRQLVWFSHA